MAGCDTSSCWVLRSAGCLAGGYFSVAGGDVSILLRQKEDYDGAEPAASSIAAANLFQLAALSSADQCRKWVCRTVGSTSAPFTIYRNAEEAHVMGIT